jgi:hypothetical protein
MSNTFFIPNAPIPAQESQASQQLDNGTWFARVVQVIDLGTQTNDWKGQVSIARQFRIVFETVDELFEFSKEKGEQPYLLSKEVKFIVSKPDTAPDKVSGLTKILRACGMDTAESVNIFDLLGKICQVETQQNDKGYAQIINYTALPKSAKSLPFPDFNPLRLFYFDNFVETQEGLDAQPEFIKNKIMESPEWKAWSSPVPQIKQPPQANDEQLPDVAEIDLSEAVKVTMPF